MGHFFNGIGELAALRREVEQLREDRVAALNLANALADLLDYATVYDLPPGEPLRLARETLARECRKLGIEEG